VIDHGHQLGLLGYAHTLSQLKVAVRLYRGSIAHHVKPLNVAAADAALVRIEALLNALPSAFEEPHVKF